MAKQASKTVIGGFVISAIVLLIGAVILFGSGKMFEKKVKYVMYFEKSVKGLSVGSAVVCRGVPIGSVTGIALDIERDSLDFKVPVFAEIYPSRLQVQGGPVKDKDRGTNIQRLIERGMRAQLSMESIVTGQMMIEIVFNPDTPVNLVGIDPDRLEIPTTTSAMDQLAQKLETLPIGELSENLLSVIQNIDKVVGSPELMAIVQNLESAGKNLAGLVSNADGMVKNADQEVKTLMGNLDTKTDTLSASIERTLGDVQSFIKAADKEIQAVSGHAQNVLKDIDGKIPPLADQAQQVLMSARQAMNDAQIALNDVDRFVGDKSEIRRKLGRSLDEIAGAARSLRSLMDYLERHPESLLKGKGS